MILSLEILITGLLLLIAIAGSMEWGFRRWPWRTIQSTRARRRLEIFVSGLGTLLCLAVRLIWNSRALLIGCLGYVIILTLLTIRWRGQQDAALAHAITPVKHPIDQPGFEEFIADLLIRQGYMVTPIVDVDRCGADCMVEKLRTRTVVRCVQHTQTIGVAPVQEIVAARAYYGCAKGLLVTNQYLHQRAQRLADINGIEVWDRSRLLEVLTPPTAGPATTEGTPPNPQGSQRTPQPPGEAHRICSRCAAPMELRRGQYGAYYGCSQFPHCRHTENVVSADDPQTAAP